MAEEYLEARFRLYCTVYKHKTTRAAEKMLEALFTLAAAGMKDDVSAQREPVLRYFASDAPSLGSYLDLDDAAVWSVLTVLAKQRDGRIPELARRLRDRELYKCVDVGVRDEPGGNLYLRFRRKLGEDPVDWRDDMFFDDTTVTPYKWYDFDNASALNKVLVKTREDMAEPTDIANTSSIVKTLRGEERIQRVYAPDSDKAGELWKILEEVER